MQITFTEEEIKTAIAQYTTNLGLTFEGNPDIELNNARKGITASIDITPDASIVLGSTSMTIINNKDTDTLPFEPDPVVKEKPVIKDSKPVPKAKPKPVKKVETEAEPASLFGTMDGGNKEAVGLFAEQPTSTPVADITGPGVVADPDPLVEEEAPISESVATADTLFAVQPDA